MIQADATHDRHFTPAERGVLRHFAGAPRLLSSCAPLQPVAQRLLAEGFLMTIGKGLGGQPPRPKLVLRLSNKGVDAVQGLDRA